jgi:hypothetical protein
VRLQQVYDVLGFPTPAWLVFLAVCEVVSVVLVIRLWMKRKDLSVFGRIVRSIVLLIPFFGLILYIPLTSSVLRPRSSVFCAVRRACRPLASL